jgi:predicted transcriptional regulator
VKTDDLDMRVMGVLAANRREHQSWMFFDDLWTIIGQSSNRVYNSLYRLSKHGILEREPEPVGGDNQPRMRYRLAGEHVEYAASYVQSLAGRLNEVSRMTGADALQLMACVVWLLRTTKGPLTAGQIQDQLRVGNVQSQIWQRCLRDLVWEDSTILLTWSSVGPERQFEYRPSSTGS